MTGSLPDPNQSLDFADLVGRLRRSAATAARHGQMDELETLAHDLLVWQARLQRAIQFAISEEPDPTVTWTKIVNQVGTVRHERDSAQQLHQMAADDLRRYDEQYSRQKEELDALRAQKET